MNPKESAISTKGGAESAALATNHHLSWLFGGVTDIPKSAKTSSLATTKVTRQ